MGKKTCMLSIDPRIEWNLKKCKFSLPNLSSVLPTLALITCTHPSKRSPRKLGKETAHTLVGEGVEECGFYLC